MGGGGKVKRDTVDIVQEHEILNFISVPAGTTLKGDKTNNDIDKMEQRFT